MKPEKMERGLLKKLDLVTMSVPLIGIVVLCALFMILPEQSTNVLGTIRSFLGDDLGLYYVLIAAAALICSMYMAFSKYGKIKLGNIEKPEYSNYKWGAMIFTSTMAADILFYSLCEWALYANEPQIEAMGGIQKWASTYPLFHWGPTAWSFYIVLAVAFGFMLHVRGREKQKFSEACRPLLGDKVDGWLGRLIDLIAVLALLAGTATTFSMATPLLSSALGEVLHIPAGITLTIMILLMIAIVYTLTVWFGMKGVSRLATGCTYLFFALLVYFLVGGGEIRYILETGVSSIGNLVQNFIGMSTWTDPLRETSFVQNWTIFYWKDQQRTNNPEYGAWRIRMGTGRNVYFVYRTWKLWLIPADERNDRHSRRNCGRRRCFGGDFGNFPHTASSESGIVDSCYYNDRFLCDNI